VLGQARRLARPLRAIGRGRHPPPSDQDAEPRPEERIDSWLEHYYGEQLAELDAACAADGSYAHFRDLDDDLWSLLLTQQYEVYPNIRAVLPRMPPRELQEMWNGASGLTLASQSKAFYVRLRDAYLRHGGRPLSEARILDFGCGWGRLTRLLARDAGTGRLYGCDPVQGILDECRRDRVPAKLAKSEFVPEQIPFGEHFDLAFAFSVFTHLSEQAHERCLLALHRSLAEDGILVVTVRPPSYVRFCAPLSEQFGPIGDAALERARYLFVPHEASPQHPQYRGEGKIDYGEAVVTMSYIRERWSTQLELLEVGVLIEDPYQVMLTLRRRG